MSIDIKEAVKAARESARALFDLHRHKGGVTDAGLFLTAREQRLVLVTADLRRSDAQAPLIFFEISEIATG